VVIDGWARSLGDAWQDFNEETSKLAGAQMRIANEILKTGLEKEIFWGAVQASVIAGSESENGDIFVGLATMQYLNNIAQWGYQGAVEAGITPGDLGNAFQWVPASWVPEARTMIEAWANGAPEDKRAGIYAEIAGEFERVQKATSSWGHSLRQAARSVVAEWAKLGPKPPEAAAPTE